MTLGVFTPTEEFEILWSIVEPDSISMMYVFPGDGVESVFCDHHQPMDSN